MADDFLDLKAKMYEHTGLIDEFLQTVGLTLILCQAFEDRLRQYYVLAFEMKPGDAESEVTKLLEKSRDKDTLEALLRKLKTRMQMDQKTSDFLTEFLDERNWFIHHLEYQHGLDVYDPQALSPLLERLDHLKGRAIYLTKEVGRLSMAFVQSKGISAEQIDQETRRLLQQRIKPA